MGAETLTTVPAFSGDLGLGSYSKPNLPISNDLEQPVLVQALAHLSDETHRNLPMQLYGLPAPSPIDISVPFGGSHPPVTVRYVPQEFGQLVDDIVRKPILAPRRYLDRDPRDMAQIIRLLRRGQTSYAQLEIHDALQLEEPDHIAFAIKDKRTGEASLLVVPLVPPKVAWGVGYVPSEAVLAQERQRDLERRALRELEDRLAQLVRTGNIEMVRGRVAEAKIPHKPSERIRETRSRIAAIWGRNTREAKAYLNLYTNRRTKQYAHGVSKVSQARMFMEQVRTTAERSLEDVRVPIFTTDERTWGHRDLFKAMRATGMVVFSGKR